MVTSAASRLHRRCSASCWSCSPWRCAGASGAPGAHRGGAARPVAGRCTCCAGTPGGPCWSRCCCWSGCWSTAREFYALGDPRTRWRVAGGGRGCWRWSAWPSGCCPGVGPPADPARRAPGFGETLRARRLRPGRGHRAAAFASDALRRLRLRAAARAGPAHARWSRRSWRCAGPSRCRPLGPDDEDRMRGCWLEHGQRDSLGYFALRRDKSVIWSPVRQGRRSPTGSTRA